MRYVYSVVAPESVRGALRTHYAIDEKDCRLLRAYVNDVYEAGDYIIKIYRAGWRSRDDILFEIDLLRHLAAQGVSVSPPLAKTDGDFLHSLEAAEGTRYFVVFAKAPGHKPKAPFADALYGGVGEALGKLHRAADGFSSPHHRVRFLYPELVESPMAALEPHLAHRPGDWRFLLDAAREAKSALQKYENQLHTGIIHGDMTLDNLHVDEEGRVTFYDFDTCGHGYRAQDLLGAYKVWKVLGDERKWRLELEGYQKHCEASEADIAFLPYLSVMVDIWSLGQNATIWAKTSGLWRIGDYALDAALREMRDWTQKNW